MDNQSTPPAKKPFIKMVRVFAENDCVCIIDDGTGNTTEITILNATLGERDLDSRYAYLKVRGERFITCMVVAE